MLLQVSGITKSYGVNTVLSNISLQIEARERIGLVGVNGAGKSTLLQIIAGELSYDGGQIFKSKETRIGYLKQNSGLHSDRSMWNELLSVFSDLLETEGELRRLEALMADETVLADEKKTEDTMKRYAELSDRFRERGGYEIEAKIRGILNGMGFGSMDPATPVQALSGGQKTRLALAKMLLEAPDLLLLDEPTNHLDIATLTWLEQYLRSYSGAILVVSHDRYFLDALVDAIYEIERTTSRRYTGNYTRYVELKEADYEIQLKQYEKQQDEIAKMEEFVQRNIVRASTTKRAQSRRKALEKMERIDKPLGDLKRASFSFEVDSISGREVLDVRGVAVSYDGVNPLIRNVTFQLRRGDTAALIGPNGVGKSTLLKTLIGQHAPDRGSFTWGANVKIGYYDQEQTGLNPHNTVLEELWSEYPHLEEARVRTVLGSFLFSGEDVFKKVGSLSGGEKARVALAKLMLLKANVLILDEPTNHLDLYSKEVLESALIDYEGTLLFISHDRYFLNKMAESMLELAADGVTGYLGNYDDYMEKKQELAEMEQERLAKEAAARSAKSAGGAGSSVQETDSIKGSGYEAGKQAKREERSRQRRLEQLEAQIAQLETEIGETEAELALPEVYNDYVLVQQKNALLEEKRAQLTACYEEWEGLAE
ncbi:ATP-binding cassette domain-containing protein [Paenibacillus mucilaginosus]|uniref:YdiF n=2 Tax=Paenibacillus mucilaginosus TaxID=61624 RepID=H6NSV6_9BACL|nr:ATP-binding cassette domain-containing protein [Paenibacillus mucilaginosus]AEI39210.1 YdiF [Paenibacillus mucilaginosus KNP414]AFC27497.1 YdiF [Paenibacillus mucilaginosus 3016]MCG7217147.1 ATP-binding cassette domain-containing protein [Paenibacillus mucilaginosus]WDM28220.1 ATP-binding cassette domain-containing protein [Paenibacillus mucilaginosus]WFA16398.1 ATP-binding cassette domain-containing protein [Paenibacillus mucilaginosus]